MHNFVKDAVATTEDALGNIIQVLERLDCELEGLVDSRDIQTLPSRLAKIADYRLACRGFKKDLQKFFTETDKFKESLNG